MEQIVEIPEEEKKEAAEEQTVLQKTTESKE